MNIAKLLRGSGCRVIRHFPLDANRHIAALSRALEHEVIEKIGTQPLPSMRKQLRRLSKV